MYRCKSGKRVYTTVVEAEQALIDAHRQTAFPDGQGPIAVYRCDDCGFYHFTSGGVMNEALAKYLRSSDIKLHREANRWIDKLGKKR